MKPLQRFENRAATLAAHAFLNIGETMWYKLSRFMQIKCAVALAFTYENEFAVGFSM